jgi:hypothetical protein
MLYLAILPLFARQFKDTTRTAPYHFARPGLWFYESSLLAQPLQVYAQNWLGKKVALRSCLTAALQSAGKSPDFPSLSQTPEFVALEQKKADFAQQLEALVVAQTAVVKGWSQEYLKELDILTERRRTAGDFEGWASAQEERKKFGESGSIDEETNEATADVTDLRLLKRKYRQLSQEQRILHNRRLMTLSKKHINDLTDQQRAYMQGAKMDIASAINSEIHRVRSLPQYVAAESDAQAMSMTVNSEKLTPSIPSSGGKSKELDMAEQREVFEKNLAAIESNVLQALGQWPENYIGELNVLMDGFQRAGNYLGWETVREEASRFEADRVILPRHLVSLKSLLAIQNKYSQVRDTLRRAKAKQIIDATEKYVANLLKYQKDLTVSGRMADASMVQAEIKWARSRLDFIEAQNVLATPPVETNGTNTVAGARDVKSEK